MNLPPLQKGILVQRYKRFLADIRLESGQNITAHCPNSGSMLSCKEPGSEVLVSFHDGKNRKLPYTWELIHTARSWVGINTQYPNKLVEEAIRNEKIPELQNVAELRREVPYGRQSRIDLLLRQDSMWCYIEVKNVTLVERETAFFPDAITERGTRHLRELTDMVQQGFRAVIFFVVQREDAELFMPAHKIDPRYAEALRLAIANGVEILVYQAKVSPEQIILDRPLPYNLS